MLVKLVVVQRACGRCGRELVGGRRVEFVGRGGPELSRGRQFG
jgi:hypothetical protein